MEQPWTEKYRPVTLQEIVHHEKIISVLSSFIAEGSLPHLLLHGPPGTGKTTTILAITRELYGEAASRSILELNASDDRDVKTVRDLVKGFSSTNRISTEGSVGFKIVILDEVDSMLVDAQNSLLALIEKYSAYVRFCLICNYVNKIIPSLQSRCVRLRFSPLPKDIMLDYLTTITTKEKMQISEDGLLTVIRLSKGDLRRSINTIQSISVSKLFADGDTICNILGVPKISEIKEIVNLLLFGDFNHAFNAISQKVGEYDISFRDIVSEIAIFIKTIDIPIKSFLFTGPIVLPEVEKTSANFLLIANERVIFEPTKGKIKRAAVNAIRSGWNRLLPSSFLIPLYCPEDL